MMDKLIGREGRNEVRRSYVALAKVWKWSQGPDKDIYIHLNTHTYNRRRRLTWAPQGAQRGPSDYRLPQAETYVAAVVVGVITRFHRRQFNMNHTV